jgi:quinohemoprotein ethanol dehydrogenase
MKGLVRFLVFGTVVSFVLFVAVSASGSGAKSAAAIPAFGVAELSAPSGANWIHENGNVQSWRYSTLNQITASNGGSLKLAWTNHLANPTSPERLAQGNANPIVYNGTMYVQDGWTRITALDAASGKTLWQFDPQVGLNVAGNGTDMRSVGMGDGMVFTGMYGTVYAINAQTGAQVWATQVVNPVGGGGIDVSPLYYKGLVVIGTTGGDWGGACEMVALDAKTGKVKWHYSTIPSSPKAYGWNTWPANRYYYGGGAIWDMGAINPKLDLVYFGTGQALPFNGLINGPGAEYGTDGVYAIHVLTGKFAWWFQEVHHDIWDYDGMQTPLVETITFNGKKVDVVDHINKDAFNYVLDAATGKPVISVVETPVPQSAQSHTYPTQPIPVGDELVPHVLPDPEDYTGILAPDGKPYIIPTTPFPIYSDQQYTVSTPGVNGGVEWPDPAWDPTRGLEVVCANVQSQGYESPSAPDQHPVISNAGAIIQLRFSGAPNALSIARLVAFNPATNKIVWKHDEVSTGGITRGNATGCASPVTTTASGLALIGRIVATPQYPSGVGMIQAYDMNNGNLAWQIPVLVNGQAVATVPRITPYLVNGKEYIVSFTHFSTAGADISAYALP